MKIFLIGLGVLFFLMLIPGLLAAQPGGGGPAGEPSVPISGIEILIAIGGALGIRKFLLEKRKGNS